MNARYITPIALISTLFIGALLLQYSTPEVHGQASSTITSGVSITITGTSTGGGGGRGVKNPADITFSGFAYPNAVVTLLKNGTVIGTALTQNDGTFIKNAMVDSGLITFGIWARDNSGLTSATANLTINVEANSKVYISNIFLSPTITADKFNLQRGGTLRIFGSAFPGSVVRLFNNLSASQTPIAEVIADINGAWEYFFPTGNLGDGQYSLKANAQIDSPFMVSSFSENLEFTIAEIQCSGADFNLDARINIIDFSILIFYWQRNPAIGDPTNICTDLNTDEIVNIFDFSILMHQWTG